jgi:hypothetical protein
VAQVVERAFQLAGGGACATVTQVKRQLKREGFTVGEIEGQLGGASLFGQLKRLCLAGRPASLRRGGRAPAADLPR